MQVRLASDQAPVTAKQAVPLGTGRISAALTSTGAQTALTLSHALARKALASCEFVLDVDPADAWRGELNAEMAIFTEEFNASDCRFARETIAHLQSDLFVMRTQSEKPFAGEIGWAEVATPLVSDNRVSLAGRDDNGIPWQAEIRIHLADGELGRTDDGRIAFRNTHEVVCEISLGYGDKGRAGAECGSHRIKEVEGWDSLVQQHVDLWRQHFGGLVGTVPGQDPAPLIPQRLALLAGGKPDPRLYFALWQASRYRLCTRFGTAPPAPLGPIGEWLGLIASGLPAYLSRQLEATNGEISPYFQLASSLQQTYFAESHSASDYIEQIADALPDSPAATIWHATVNRDPAALQTALDAYLAVNGTPWLCGNDAGVIAAAFPAMLVQAEDKALRICPCLPTSWAQGAAHGLLAPGGWTLSLEWSLSRPTKLVIAGHPAGNCELRNLPDEYTLVDDHEKAVPFAQADDVISFTARPRQAYFLQRQKIR